MNVFEFDELSIYRGKDIYITPKIIVTQPTLSQIEEFGEKKYFQAVQYLTSVGADLKWQLWDIGVDYTEIEDYDLFVSFICRFLSSKKKLYEQLLNNEEYADKINDLPDEELKSLLINPLELILKNIDLADFTLCTLGDTEQLILYDEEHDITIDRFVYTRIVEVVRKIHGFKRNNQIPANEKTKMDLIDDARDEAMMAANKPYKSTLKPYISAFAIKCGVCANDERIWNMNIGMFLDGIRRISKVRDADSLLQGAYSGFANLKGVDRTRFDWAGDI